jgi:hypothetical protein
MDEETTRTAEGIFVALVIGSALWMMAYLVWNWFR